MSKQVKLKFKKLLKKAEFVHADLEYHEELFPDAQQEFFVAVNKIFDSLDLEVQKQLNEFRNQKLMARETSGASRDGEQTDENDSDDGKENTELLITPDHPDGIDMNEDTDTPENPGIKSSEAKKLFYKIAELTHPDKLLNKQFSADESRRLEKLFIKATQAYNSLNWYTLYSIALELNLDVEDPRKEYLAWIEEDIRYTMGSIATIGGKIVWVWYTGDEKSKIFALKNYFEQVYNYTLEK